METAARLATPNANVSRSTSTRLSGDTQSPASSGVPLLSELLRLRHRSARASRRAARELARNPPNRAVSPIPLWRLRSGTLEAARLGDDHNYGQALLSRVAADGDRHRRPTAVPSKEGQ